MTKEKIEKGKELLAEIDKVTHHIEGLKNWKQQTYNMIECGRVDAELDQITFNTVMTIIISSQESKLEELQKRFNEL
jgi:hypothetical protein